MVSIQTRFPTIDTIVMRENLIAVQVYHVFRDPVEQELSELSQQLADVHLEQFEEIHNNWQALYGQYSERMNAHIGWEAETWSISRQESLGQYAMTNETLGNIALGLALDHNSPCPLTMTHYGLMSGDGRRVCEIENRGGVVSDFTVSQDRKRALACLYFPLATVGQSEKIGEVITFFQDEQTENWNQSSRVVSTDRYFVCGLLLPTGNQLLLFETSQPAHEWYDHTISHSRSLWIHGIPRSNSKKLIELEVFPSSLSLCGQHLCLNSRRGFEVRHLENVETPVLHLDYDTNSPTPATPVGDSHGRYLLTAQADEVNVWDTKSWTITKTYCWNAGKITCLAMAPDGLTAAAGTNTGKVVIWDME